MHFLSGPGDPPPGAGDPDLSQRGVGDPLDCAVLMDIEKIFCFFGSLKIC